MCSLWSSFVHPSPAALILRDARTPIRACGTDGACALLRVRARARFTPRREFRLMVKSRAQLGVSNHEAAIYLHHQLPSGFASSSGKYLNTHSSGLGAAWPSPQIEASRMASESSANNA